jgi:CxxC motif-containing protein
MVSCVFVMPNKIYVCIICPNSCEIDVEYEGKDVKKISGNTCRKGEEYVRKELSAPQRGVTGTVLVKDGTIPLVSVKTSKAVPKDMMKSVADAFSNSQVIAPVKMGDVIVKNILGTGADIVATKDVKKKTL